MPESFLRLLDIRKTADKKTIRVALVSEIVDSYETVIEPDGLISPFESVVVDYNHNRISTGAKIFDAGFTSLTVPDGAGGEKKVRARVVDIEVYKDSKMWTQANQHKRAEEVHSLYDAVENGRVGWASVDFEPVKSETERVVDSHGNIKREVYRKWRLNFFSLLDTKPGQDTSYFLSVRAKDLSIIKKGSMKRNKEQVVGLVTELLTQAEVEVEDVGNVAVHYPDEGDPFVTFVLNGETLHKVAAEEGEDGMLVLAGEVEEIEKIVIEAPTMGREEEEEETAEEEPEQEGAPVEAPEEEQLRSAKGSFQRTLDVIKKKIVGFEKEFKRMKDAMEKQRNKEVADFEKKLAEKDEALTRMKTQYERLSKSPKAPTDSPVDAATDMGNQGGSEGASKDDQAEKILRQMSRDRFI